MKISSKVKINFPFLFLIIGMLISCISYIIPNIEGKVSTNSFEVEPVGEILKNTKISQEIYIPKNMKKYGIVFATYARNNRGSVKVKIIQNTVKLEKVIDISKLEDNQLEDIDLNYNKLKEGKALLLIEGIDGVPGNSITIYESSDISLGKAVINNKETKKGIVQEIEYLKITKIVKIQVILTMILMVILMYFNKLLKEPEKESKKIYIITIIIMYCFISIKFPIMTICTEPYAEIITNFFFNASTKSMFKNLLISDAGYLPLYQRIVSLIIVKSFSFSPKVSVILMQNILILIMLSISSTFVLKEYKKYGTIFFRFIICLILSGFPMLNISEVYTFINVGYFNLVGVILISLLNLKKLNQKTFIFLMIITFFLCLSKAHFIVLFPIVVMIYAIFRKKMFKREKIFLFSIAFSTFIQFIYTYMNKNKWSSNEQKIKLFKSIEAMFYNVVQHLIYFFFSNVSTDSNIFGLNCIFLIIVFISIISSFYYFYKYRNKESIILISLILLIFGVTMFNIKAGIWSLDSWIKATGIMKLRHSFFILISIIFSMILLIYNYFKDKKEKLLKNSFYTILGLTIFIRALVFDNQYITMSKENSFSDWNIYSKFYKENEYIIPINPEYWYIKKNINVHYIGYRDGVGEMFKDDKKSKFLNHDIQQIHEINFDFPIFLTHLFLTRLRENNFDKLKIKGYDSYGNVVVELDQLNDKTRKYIGFRNYKKVAISKIEILNKESQKSYVIPEIIYGESF